MCFIQDFFPLRGLPEAQQFNSTSKPKSAHIELEHFSEITHVVNSCYDNSAASFRRFTWLTGGFRL